MWQPHVATACGNRMWQPACGRCAWPQVRSPRKLSLPRLWARCTWLMVCGSSCLDRCSISRPRSSSSLSRRVNSASSCCVCSLARRSSSSSRLLSRSSLSRDGFAEDASRASGAACTSPCRTGFAVRVGCWSSLGIGGPKRAYTAHRLCCQPSDPDVARLQHLGQAHRLHHRLHHMCLHHIQHHPLWLAVGAVSISLSKPHCSAYCDCAH